MHPLVYFTLLSVLTFLLILLLIVWGAGWLW